MDFFEHQEQARRKTGVLVVLFIAAVVCTVVVMNLAMLALLSSRGVSVGGVIVATTLGVLAVLVVGSLVKVAQMSAGGVAVAEALGGTPLRPDTRDPDERRVLNIVEEMAIASGLPVPPVYIMEDESINAFAAGRTHQDSVIGLTRGCVRLLNRDELQGVVAHEFSHIFHRDTTLNMRLVAWLGGIFALALVGQAILRSMRYSSSRSKNNASPAAIGMVLLVVGSVGYFFGRLIQSAVSRQREYLADASAVQYTRNPDGLAGALEKIVRGAGSRISAPRATEFSHFFFANGLNSLFSTHPPAEERIRRIRGLRVAPALHAEPAAALSTAPATTPRSHAAALHAGEPAPRAVPPVAGRAAAGVAALASNAVRASASHAGSLSPGQLERASAILAALPRTLVHGAHNPFDARAVVAGLLLSPDARVRARQWARIHETDARLADALTGYEPALAAVTPGLRLPLLEICAASLSLLSPHQYAEFRALLADIIGADGEVDRFEWIVRIVLRRSVERRGAGGEHAHAPTAHDAALATSVLAYSGARDMAGARAAWAAARQANGALPPEPLPTAECTLDALDASLGALDRCTPRQKRSVVEGCVAAVCADSTTTAVEAELLRAICDGIGVPMPPVGGEIG